ncbi:hypothetical protein SAMN05216226_11281 [Halovenus aranensis]|uniref:Uncharacterized protein n=1 Tax=Halovenus aranensis TaxID=890420 RepID=A0A1G8XU79_9EURY|nr:hypothetical protein [Halovenus aranensis]SDJ94016.1 hypothetical protein SAMN05216226_11281 [Halovenus aranensis]
MRTSRNAVVGLLFVCFLGAVLLRPLVAMPGAAAVLSGESGLVFWLPLATVGLLVGWLRIRSADDGDSQPRRQPAGNHWGEKRDGTERDSTDPSERVLGGQGGARDRSFDIETKPPAAELSDHLDHLRAELDGEETELRTLETVVEEAENEETVPDRCPGAHCDALWEARTVTGATAGRYERLDDTTVCCLECEETFEL